MLLRWCIALVLLVGLSSCDSAQTTKEHAALTPTLLLSPSKGRTGATVEVTGAGYCGSVGLRWDKEIALLKSGDSDEQGNISIVFTVPEKARSGRHIVTSFSRCGGAKASFDVVFGPDTTSISPPGPTESSSPSTESELPPPPPAESAPGGPPDAGAPTNEQPTGQPPVGQLPTGRPSTGRPPPVEPPDKTERQSYLDSQLSLLRKGRLVYRSPSPMRVDEWRRVVVRVADPAMPPDIEQGLQGQGPIVDRNVDVGSDLVADLEGPDFRIVRVGNDDGRRTLVTGKFAEWQWDVQPLRSGRRTISLILYVRLEDGGPPLEVKTFDEQIEVQVNPIYTVSQWVKTYWPATGLTVPVIVAAGWALTRRRRRDEPAARG